jgi:hypothetical protein
MGYNRFKKGPIIGERGVYSYGAPVAIETSVWGKGAIAVFVDATNGSATGDGKSWDTAVNTLALGYSTGIARVSSGHPIHIFVAPGAYTVSSAVAVTYPYVYWIGAGANRPYGGGLCTITETDQVSVFTYSAAADGGGVFGFNIACTPTGATDAIITTSTCSDFTVMNNTFISGDGDIAYTAITGTGAYENFSYNRFISCRIGISSGAGSSYSHIEGNYFYTASHTATTYGITKLSGSSYGEVVNNYFDLADDAHTIALNIASGANYNRVIDNVFKALTSPRAITDAGTGTVFNHNWKSGTPDTSFDFSSQTGNPQDWVREIIS